MANIIYKCSVRSNLRIYKSRLYKVQLESYTSSVTAETVKYSANDENEFRQLELIKRKEQRRPREKLKVTMLPPRYTKMPVDQDWSSVWPTAHSFKPSVVPIPLRQGFTEKGAPPPDKFGNLELMKIPNFLHLTPPAIKKHCDAIKKFCTPWPKALNTDEKCKKYFPVDIISSDYCHSGPIIRDPRARIVTLQVKLETLCLNSHAKDKLLRLAGDRYNKNTDVLTLVADRCPLKKQNYDYLCYLLTALYHESKKTEFWEQLKAEADMEKYVWKGSKSEETLMALRKNAKVVSVNNEEATKSYATAVENLHNDGEEDKTILEYKNAVKKLIGLPSE